MLRSKNTKNDESGGYWISFSDLMSGTLIVFILLFIFVLASYQVNMKEYKERISEKEEMIQELTDTRFEIIAMLQEEFKKEGLEISIDSNTGAITLSESILFDFGKSELKQEGKDFLSKFIPIYLRILVGHDDIKKHLAQIIIEGHTDNNSTYIYNLQLSQERALSVASYLLGDSLQYEYKEELEKFLSANGRSYSELKLNKDGSVDENKSRRVEIKFRLKEEETLLQIKEELSKVSKNE